MADLVTISEMKDFLGDEDIAGDDETTLQTILDSVEDALEYRTGETFEAAGTSVTDEAHDGRGTDVIYADQPVGTLSEVKVGQDPNSPDDDLTIGADEDVVADGRRIVRVDGAVFPWGRRNVFLSYTSAANTPKVAKLAVLEGTAFFWRRRGAEHVASESIGEFGARSIAAILDRQPAWSNAIATLRTPKVS